MKAPIAGRLTKASAMVIAAVGCNAAFAQTTPPVLLPANIFQLIQGARLNDGSLTDQESSRGAGALTNGIVTTLAAYTPGSGIVSASIGPSIYGDQYGEVGATFYFLVSGPPATVPLFFHANGSVSAPTDGGAEATISFSTSADSSGGLGVSAGYMNGVPSAAMNVNIVLPILTNTPYYFSLSAAVSEVAGANAVPVIATVDPDIGFQPGFDSTGYTLMVSPAASPIAKNSILWQNSNGDVVRWFMNGGTIASSADLGVIPPAWSIQGTGDFSGVGQSDILWRNTNGDVVIWFMNGGVITSSADLGVIPASWTIAGTGDFNGDGKPDILWRNSDGDVVIWFMNGSSIVSSADVGVIPATWTIQGTGDFNADGNADILWRNTNGDVVIWFMNAGTIASSADLGVIPSTWTIQGTGVNGSPDILWRNANGDTVLWFMHGGTITSSADLGVVPSSWTIQGTGDFNADGQSDILWRNANGDVVVWFMNGGSISSSADLGVVPATWAVQP